MGKNKKLLVYVRLVLSLAGYMCVVLPTWFYVGNACGIVDYDRYLVDGVVVLCKRIQFWDLF